MGRSDGTLAACDAPADQAGSATLSVTGKRLDGAVIEEIMEPALVPALRNFAHFREINEMGCPHTEVPARASSSSRARLIRRDQTALASRALAPIGLFEGLRGHPEKVAGCARLIHDF